MTLFRWWDGNWHHKLLSRFSDRKVLDREEVIRLYWGDLRHHDVSQLFDFIELEYRVPAGLFRPHDPVGKLLEPVPTRNPMLWPLYQLTSSDKHSELIRELGWRGVVEIASLKTFDDLMRSWCGLHV